MLKKLHHIILACALLLAPAPAAFAYKEVCLHLKEAGYVASFWVDFQKRDNPNGLDTHYVNQKRRNVKAIGHIDAHSYKCFTLSSINARPGDRLKFFVSAVAGNVSECRPNAGYASTHEGFWLVPDGPARGKLTFVSSGVSFHHGCHEEENALRMHTECNSTFDGMANTGCGHWRPTVTRTVLHDIARNGSGKGMLGSAIQRGADVNESLPTYSGFPGYSTPLHVAVHHGQADYVEYLLEQGANPNARNAQGSTPVMKAVAGNNVEILRHLLDHDGSPTYAEHSGLFPLYVAARDNNLELVKILLDAGGARALNFKRQNTGETALAVAKKSGASEVLAHLRRLGAKEKVYDSIVFDIVNDDRGLSPLRSALHEGANVDFPGAEGKTALHVIAERNLSKYLRDLLKLDAGRVNLDLQDDEGRTPLLSSVAANADSTQVLRQLVSRADPNLAAADGNFPLYQAVGNARRDIVQMLAFNRRLDMNQRHPGTGLTSLGLAKELAAENPEDYTSIVSFLERRGAGE